MKRFVEYVVQVVVVVVVVVVVIVIVVIGCFRASKSHGQDGNLFDVLVVNEQVKESYDVLLLEFRIGEAGLPKVAVHLLGGGELVGM